MKTILFTIILLVAIPLQAKDLEDAHRAIDEIAITFTTVFASSAVCAGTSKDPEVIKIARHLIDRSSNMYSIFLNDTLIMEKTRALVKERVKAYNGVYTDGLLFSDKLRKEVCTVEKLNTMDMRLDYLASFIFQSA